LWRILACGYGAGKREHFSLPVPSMEADHVCSLCTPVNKKIIPRVVPFKRKMQGPIPLSKIKYKVTGNEIP